MANILVVGDNETNRKLVVALLQCASHAVVQATDGVFGLAAARTDKPQLVISDILMPSTDGFEFVRQLREDRGLGSVDVIFLTANYHEREAQNRASGNVFGSIVRMIRALLAAGVIPMVSSGASQVTAPGAIDALALNTAGSGGSIERAQRPNAKGRPLRWSRSAALALWCSVAGTTIIAGSRCATTALASGNLRTPRSASLAWSDGCRRAWHLRSASRWRLQDPAERIDRLARIHGQLRAEAAHH